MHQKFDRCFDSLSAILACTDEFFQTRPIDPSARYTVDLAIDELFSNMVKYNAHSPSPIGLSLALSEQIITVTLSDYQSEPFDITQRRPVDVTLSVQDRPIGGLGIHLVKEMVDSLDYDYSDGCSTITFTKITGKSDA
ncbi:MAG: ATP-binding protein [Chromatiales bacterium]|nr:ATP-binding protein [Chromatiales bacterium]